MERRCSHERKTVKNMKSIAHRSKTHFGLKGQTATMVLLIILLASFMGVDSFGSSNKVEAFDAIPFDENTRLDTNRVDSMIKMNQQDSIGLEFMDVHLRVIQEDLTQLEREIRALKEKYLKLARLIPKEQLMYSQFKKIKTLFTNVDDRSDFNSYHRNISDALLMYGKEKIDDYSRLGLSDKEKKVKDYISCFEELLSIYPAYVKLEEEMEFLDKAFTKKVLNPYTMTDMDERRKKDIFERFDEVLLPYLIRDLEDNLDCETLPSKLNNFEVFYERLLELRDADTEKLELELGERESPEELIELFDLEFNLDQ